MTGKGHRLVPSPSFPSSPLPAMDFLLRPQVRGALNPPAPTLASSPCSLASAASRRLPPAANSGESGAGAWGSRLELLGWGVGSKGGVGGMPLTPVSCVQYPCCSCPHLGVSPGPAFLLALLPSLLLALATGTATEGAPYPALGDPDALEVQKLLSKYLAVPGAETGRGGGGRTETAARQQAA